MNKLKRIFETFIANLEQFFYVPPGYPKIRTFFFGAKKKAPKGIEYDS